MSRQIHFHMLPEDRSNFLSLAQQQHGVTVTRRDADSAEIQPVSDSDIADNRVLCLWNRELLTHLERERIQAGSYRVDVLGTPTLEFTSSILTTWEEKPALVQGRLYGIFDQYLGKPRAFEKWYQTLVHWIRKSYQRNPASTGGYVGPAAYEFYEKGGYLLPQFIPPRTDVWVAEIGKQHSLAKRPMSKSTHRKMRSRK